MVVLIFIDVGLFGWRLVSLGYFVLIYEVWEIDLNFGYLILVFNMDFFFWDFFGGIELIVIRLI